MNTGILDKLQLSQGGGAGDPKKGLCVMELASFLEGADVPTDHPHSASPLLTRFAIALNDNAPSVRARNTLKTLAPVLVGTRAPRRDTARRNFIHREIVRRVAAPILTRAGYSAIARDLKNARALSDMNELIDKARATLPPGPARDVIGWIDDALDQPQFHLAEHILILADCGRLDDGDPRHRRALWNTMRDILEEACRIGPHASLSEGALGARLDTLSALLWPRARKAATAAPALPAWLDALIHGPSGTPDLPAPPTKPAPAVLEDA